VFSGTDVTQIASLFIDRDQSLWMGTSNDGVYRVSGERVDHFRSSDGLTSNMVRAFFEDREGNLWVATSKGLDCFRDTRVVTFSTREGLATDLASSVLASSDGTTWIGNRGSLDVLVADKVTSIPIPGQRVTSLWQDRAKRLWVGVDNQLTVYERGHFREIGRPDGRPLGTVVAIAEDREQNLWVSAVGADRRLFRIRNQRVEKEFTSDQIPSARLLAADPTGGIWLGLGNGDLAHYASGKLEVIPLKQGEGALPGLTIDADGSAWASTRSGIVHWKDREIKTLTSRNGLPCDAAFAAIRDMGATLWIYAKCGLIAIADSELARWWQQPDTTIQFRVFDAFDGAMPGLGTFQPAVSRSPDGRLWFVNDTVVQMFDPGGSRSNPLAPPVHVEGVRADRHDYAVGAPIRLPARSRDIEIRYTALSFAVPQKVQFRYRLDGRDREWQDAGTRRQAFYNDLGPGTYRFRVIASNNDGVWNEEGASIEMVIAPAWYQTRAFAVLSILAGVLVVWVAYSLRMQQVARALNARFDERLAERTRMARDLHDTLLQTVQGSKMVADTALDRPDDAPALARALQQVSAWLGHAGEEGRATVHALRTSTTESNNLAEAFRRAVEDCRRQGAIDASLTVTGDVREMHPVVRDEVYRIGYEAIRNAYTHSQGSRVVVALGYGHGLTLRVADDGVGMESTVAERGKEGHFGLRGMRERAARIGATLSVTTAPGTGTAIVVTVPGRVIFRKASTPLAARIRSRLFRTDETPTLP
jgi:signal transduction histidine kinase